MALEASVTDLRRAAFFLATFFKERSDPILAGRGLREEGGGR